MEKIRNLPIRVSFILYILTFLIFSFVLTGITQIIISTQRQQLIVKYFGQENRYYLTNEYGEQLGDGVLISNIPIQYKEKDEILLEVYEIIYNGCSSIYGGISIICAVLVFYNNKLKKPLEILEDASKKIRENNLDFKVIYDKKDEMGLLCMSFEKMRNALFQNNKMIWQQMEERRKINSAFAHDLRTPLTVLKGYTEILQFEDNDLQTVINTAKTMEKHVTRIEQFVDKMNELQKQEDLTPVIKENHVNDFSNEIEELAQMICSSNRLKLVFASRWVSDIILIDEKIVYRVLENILANAIRFAKSQITILIEETHGEIILIVEDDGIGFSEEALKEAVNPYYTEDKGKNLHYGLGLYICKVLCQYHGGDIFLENTPKGGQVTATFKKDI